MGERADIIIFGLQSTGGPSCGQASNEVYG